MSFKLNLKDGKVLISLARKAIEKWLTKKKEIEIPDLPKKFFKRCGVFVTINKVKNDKKELRGCIGYPYPNTPLIQAVLSSAISSATQDPRFQPLTKEDILQVVLEISVLTPPKLVEVETPIDYIKKIKVGRDGLIIEKDTRKGLLLPQVPIEWGWDEEEFLIQCCIKAGLTPDSWLQKDIKIYSFQAIIFNENKPEGKIEIKEFEGEK
jgi:uncharacterized protein (TIGR00296 family)